MYDQAILGKKGTGNMAQFRPIIAKRISPWLGKLLQPTNLLC